MCSLYPTPKDSLFHGYREVYNETYKTTRNDTDFLWTPHNTTTKKEGKDTNLEIKLLGKNVVFLSVKYSIKHFILFLSSNVSEYLINLFFWFLNR